MVLKEIISQVEFSSDGTIQFDPSTHEDFKVNSLLKKLGAEGLFYYRTGNWLTGGVAIISELNTKLIREVIARLDEYEAGVITSDEYEDSKRDTENFQNNIKISIDKGETEVLEMQDIPRWQEDFKWHDKRFVFSNYGTVNFNSTQRIALFSELTKAKGNWITVKKLREVTGKDDSYIRPTIGQIERSMNPELRKYISFPSTEEDNQQPKPSQGAYRIKFTQKPL